MQVSLAIVLTIGAVAARLLLGRAQVSVYAAYRIRECVPTHVAFRERKPHAVVTLPFEKAQIGGIHAIRYPEERLWLTDKA